MKKFIFLTITIILTSSFAFAQWKSSDIPDSLKRNADAVIRRVATDFKILGPDKIILTENIVITVLNEEGKRFASFYEYYDKDSKIEYVNGVIYSDEGNVVKKIKKNDFKDVSMVDNFSLYDDNRIVTYEVYPISYPFSIEYEYRKVVNTAMFIPSWYPQYGFRVGLQNASLRVSFPDSNPLKYKSFKISQPMKSVNENGFNELLWEINNIKAVDKELYAPKPYEYLASVILGPTFFRMGGYDGSLDSWKSYGVWLEGLQKDRTDISQEVRVKMNDLVKNETDLKRKVCIIYKFMQSQTRYVSIQLGVGGWQPFPASSVEKNGYGDCKALVNYTKSLLDAVGIKSYYCPVGVNDQKIIFDDFPGAGQTNHIILCVPNGADSLWLECTSQHYPFAFISHEFQNQKVLLVDGVSSRLVNTPRAYAEKNIQSRHLKIQLDSIGNAVGEVSTWESGAELENLFPEIWSSKKDQAEIIQRKYRIPGIVFNGFDYTVNEDPIPTATERVVFKVNGLASQTGRRLFIPFNPFASIGTPPVKSKKRITDVEVEQCYTHIDTVIYTLPKGFKVEFIPKPKTITVKYGSYCSSVKEQDNRLITTRKYVLNRNKYPAADYNSFVDFLLEVSKQDRQTLVLVSESKNI